MIRWRFLRNRFLLVAAALAALYWGAGPAIGWLTVYGLQKVAGGRVDIARVHVGFWPPRLRYEDLRLADRRHEREDLLRADSIELAVDGAALLRRRWIVDSAKIEGLRFSEQRTTDGRLAEREQRAAGDASRSVGPAVKTLARLLAVSAQDRAGEALKELRTVQAAERLEDQWKSRYADYTARAEGIETRVREIRGSVRAVENPLRDLPQIQQAISEAQRLQADLVAIREEIDQLPASAQADIAALDEARREDQRRIARVVPVFDDAGNLNRLAPELLRDLINGELQRLRGYVAMVRNAADLTVTPPEPSRQRGVDVDLDGRQGEPAWLVRHTELRGILSMSGRKYGLVGAVDNLAASAPARPALEGRFRLQETAGAEAVRIHFHRDYRRHALGDRITIHFPEIRLPAYVLGDAKSATLASSPSTLELWAELDCDASAVRGRVIAKQRDVALSAEIAGSGQLARQVQSAVNRSLAEVDFLDIDARVEGDWRGPQVALQTNLENALGDAVRQAAGAAVEQTRQQLTEAADRAYAGQVQRLQDALAGHQQQLGALLARADNEIQQVTQKLASEAGLPALQIGRLPKLPRPRLR